MKNIYPSKKLFVLDALLEIAHGAMPVVTAILLAGHGASLRKIEWYIDHPPLRESSREADPSAWRRGIKFINKMKLDGLIEEKSWKGRKKQKYPYFIITEKGKKKLEYFYTNKNSLEGYGSPMPTDKTIVFAFDVPEKNRKKRDWIRSVLRSLDFVQLQKSIWIGHVLLPKKFLEDINDSGLINSIKIFEVNKIIK